MYVENAQDSNTPTPESLALGLYDLSLAVSQSACISASVTPPNAGNYTIVWSSSNPNVASVSAGLVTALAVGSTTIIARIPEANLTACCDVEVTPFVPVESISIAQEVVSVAVDQMVCLEAEVCPTNATKPMPAWSSGNEEIATVGKYSGLVHAHKVGSVTITATSENGENEKSDQCIVNVHPPIPVTGISIAQENVTMNEGENYQLQANIVPENATNKTVIWKTSDENVATVGMFTGMVHALRHGNVTVTAKTVDGDIYASIELKVYRDTVTIVKDDVFTRITFKNSGKEWWGIHNDVVHSEGNEILSHRAGHNLYADYEKAITNHVSAVDIITYSDSELQLLYAIDPHGVAAYVQDYADTIGTLDDTLDYKDRVFNLLFGRQPYYFTRMASGQWVMTERGNNPHAVISEAESLFGAHPIYDDYFHFSAFQAATQIIHMLLGPDWETDEEEDNPNAIANFFVGLTVEGLFAGYDSVKENVSHYLIGEGFSRLTELIIPGWILKIVNIIGTTLDVMETVIPNKYFFNGIIDYSVDTLGYDINVHKVDDEEIHLVDLENHLSASSSDE